MANDNGQVRSPDWYDVTEVLPTPKKDLGERIEMDSLPAQKPLDWLVIGPMMCLMIATLGGVIFGLAYGDAEIIKVVIDTAWKVALAVLGFVFGRATKTN